jgi:hypothetical protein
VGVLGRPRLLHAGGEYSCLHSGVVEGHNSIGEVEVEGESGPYHHSSKRTCTSECLGGGTFDCQVPSLEEASTRVQLLILYSVPIVNK